MISVEIAKIMIAGILSGVVAGWILKMGYSLRSLFKMLGVRDEKHLIFTEILSSFGITILYFYANSSNA